MFKKFCLILVFVSAAAHADDCSHLLRGGNYKSILKQIEVLNPQLSRSTDPSPAEIYLDLKRESEKFAHRGISENIAGRIRATQAEHFQVGELDIEALSIFYRNALFALEQRAAQLWRQQEVRALAARPLSPELQNFAEHLLDTFFSPNGLNDQSLSSDEAAAYFKTKPWMAFAWSEAIAAIEDGLKAESAVDDIRLPAIFDWSQQNRIRMALMQDRRPGACCLSEPGCTLCPHNRGLRKRKP